MVGDEFSQVVFNTCGGAMEDNDLTERQGFWMLKVDFIS
jgi:hypothetical protein